MNAPRRGFDNKEYATRTAAAQAKMAEAGMAGMLLTGGALFQRVSHAVLAESNPPVVPVYTRNGQADCDHPRDWCRSYAPHLDL